MWILPRRSRGGSGLSSNARGGDGFVTARARMVVRRVEVGLAREEGGRDGQISVGGVANFA